jgi:hypothetical protein
MKDFLKIVTVEDNKVDSYLKDGWELIDTTREAYGDGGFYLKYHLGLSTRSMMMKLNKIIEKYEEFGFKEQLFEKVAVSNGEIYDDYSDSPSGFRSTDATIDFMESYERNVHDKNIKYYKKNDDNAEIHF